MSRSRHDCFRSLRLAASATLVFSACATSPAPAAVASQASETRIETGTPAGGFDGAWRRRGEPDQLARAIELLTKEGAGDAAARLRLAEAHHLMAESIAVLGWTGHGTPEQHYEASAVAAAAASSAGDGEGAARYWEAASRYALAQRAGFAALVTSQASIARAMTRAAELTPQIDRGGAYRALASLAAHPADPDLRDLKRAREHADRALTIDPKAIANTLAFIEHYAVPAQDRAALADKLQELTEQAATTPEDAIARARAEQLTARIEDGLE